MGTEITLDIGGLSVDGAKNYIGNDHGSLFQDIDRQRVRTDQSGFDEEESDEPYQAEMEMGFTRPLRKAVARLELLGHTLTAAKVEYECVAAASFEERKADREGYDDDDDLPIDVMPFEEFRAFLADTSITDLDDTFVNGGENEEQRIMGRFVDEAFKARLPYFEDYLDHAWSERSYFGTLVRFLHPYTLLRLLAENTANLEAQLVWQYGPLVDSGWAEETDFVPAARRSQTYMLATEGKSDTDIIRSAFKLLYPEVADFFRFIDVSEGHPFSGTGDLVKFAKGLTKIDVHNRTVFLLDNDAEGVSALQKIRKMQLPVNMRALTLPALDAFNSFRTVGPDGETLADINGRAAAIECYLDLEAEGVPPPIVRWTNFKEGVGDYQGALQKKELYSKAFHDQARRRKAYDTGKLSAVLAEILSVCTGIATDIRGQDKMPARRPW